MAHSPSQMPHENSDTPDSNLPVPLGGTDGNQDSRRVVDAEVLDAHEDENGAKSSPNGVWNGAHGANDGSETWRHGRDGGFFYSRTFSSGNMGGMNFGRVWTAGGQGQNACLTPCVTFALFMVCLVQFGFLAGLGFVFFHTIGSVLGTLRDLQKLGVGLQSNPWPWRLGNWMLSFLLTVWLAGGFR